MGNGADGRRAGTRPIPGVGAFGGRGRPAAWAYGLRGGGVVPPGVTTRAGAQARRGVGVVLARTGAWAWMWAWRAAAVGARPEPWDPGRAGVVVVPETAWALGGGCPGGLAARRWQDDCRAGGSVPRARLAPGAASPGGWSPPRWRALPGGQLAVWVGGLRARRPAGEAARQRGRGQGALAPECGRRSPVGGKDLAARRPIFGAGQLVCRPWGPGYPNRGAVDTPGGRGW